MDKLIWNPYTFTGIFVVLEPIFPLRARFYRSHVPPFCVTNLWLTLSRSKRMHRTVQIITHPMRESVILCVSYARTLHSPRQTHRWWWRRRWIWVSTQVNRRFPNAMAIKCPLQLNYVIQTIKCTYRCIGWRKYTPSNLGNWLWADGGKFDRDGGGAGVIGKDPQLSAS